MILLIIMCVVVAVTLPRLSRFKKLDRASFSAVPPEKFEEWYQSEKKSLGLRWRACKVFFFAVLPLYVLSVIASVEGGGMGGQLVAFVQIGFFIYFIVIAIQQSGPGKQAKKLGKEYKISY